MSRKGWSFRIVEGFIRGLRTFEEAYIDPLTTTLAEIGTLDNTIIILCSDHGDMFWNLEEDLRNGLVDEEMWRHQLEPYNALTKVPLLIWGSQLQGVYPHRFRLMDVVPTLLEELNINYDPLAFDGKSVRSSDPRPLYADSAGYGFGGIALQKEGHKFLMSHRLGSTSYDISEDEYELLAKRRESTTGVEVLTEFVLGAARTDDVIVENGEDDALKRRLEALGYL
jgi:arylsulfatase A-like enzyme